MGTRNKPPISSHHGPSQDTNQATLKDNKEAQGKDFQLERYKYILQQISLLNENAQKYLTLFQTLATVIVGGGIGVFVSWKSLNITASIAKSAIQGFLGLFAILSAFVIISLLSGIFSWIDYRKEEVEILDEVVKPGFRKSPKKWNFWRWYETYIILFISVIVLLVSVFVETQVIPLIQ